MLAWLLGAAIGPAAVTIPMSWGADALAGAARNWFRRLRRSDDLSKLVKAAAGAHLDLSRDDVKAIRRLLEDRQTWAQLGHGTVEQLAQTVAASLPAGADRTAAETVLIGLSVARGLLEFAVADLDPQIFQRVLLARLERLESGQASALDEALFRLDADLGLRFTEVLDQLKRVLELLPAAHAGRIEIMTYLTTLIAWVNADPWPRDRRFGGPVLTPAVIERKLRVSASGPGHGEELDADALAVSCERLVVLGGPGSGKTWFAKRAARRCAEEALAALTDGASLDEVELPLYTTCSQLFNADGSIRAAAVTSAVNQLGDLGGIRLSEALRGFFGERNALTLLVIDSLDEATGSDQRLYQADTLPWRIILTSRPSSWDGQLSMDTGEPSRRSGSLQPLTYPADVEPFIRLWFAADPDRGADLAAQIARRPSLQAAATVPLILAFYCIVGGREPLPELRRDLYSKVINRILTGRWRDGGNRSVQVEECLDTLRSWAWSGAVSSAVSGIGAWHDDIVVRQVHLGDVGLAALDHVAAPVGADDPDTGHTPRRFVHRSLYEHLVAEYVARLPASEAADVLVPHLWYDPDWENAAPAALAAHPDRDLVLRAMIGRVASARDVPDDLSDLDGGWEFRRFLCRVASEGREADWSPEIAGLISHARIGLARLGDHEFLGATPYWPTSSRIVCPELLTRLAGETHPMRAGTLGLGIIELAPTGHEQRRACELLIPIATAAPAPELEWLSRWLIRLAPDAGERRAVREALLRALARETEPSLGEGLVAALLRFAVTSHERRETRAELLALLPSVSKGWEAAWLAAGVVQLSESPDDRRVARQALTRLLYAQTSQWAIRELIAKFLVLEPAPDEAARVRAVLVELLTGPTAIAMADELAAGVVRLGPTSADLRHVRQSLIMALDHSHGLGGTTDLILIKRLAESVTKLCANADAAEKRQACDSLLRAAEYLCPRWWGGEPVAAAAEGVVSLAANLDEEFRAGVRARLLRLLHVAVFDQGALARALARLNPTAAEQQEAREVILALLFASDSAFEAESLVQVLRELETGPDVASQVADALLSRLSGEVSAFEACCLAAAILGLGATASEKSRATDLILQRLGREEDGGEVQWNGRALLALDLPADRLRQARASLLRLLSRSLTTEAATVAEDRPDWSDPSSAATSVELLLELDPTEEEKRQARESLLRGFAEFAGLPHTDVVTLLRELQATADEERQARESLLGCLAQLPAQGDIETLAGHMAQLSPTVADLTVWLSRAAPPPELLAAVRHSSPLSDWISVLPALASARGRMRSYTLWGKRG
jgi:hypothetical protein